MIKRVAAQLLLLGWLSSLLTALPTAKLQSISLSSGNGLLHFNTTNTHLVNASQIIHYSIPQTQYAIVIITGSLINGPAMRHTLDACLSATHAAISKHGNVYMFPDPYVFKTPQMPYTGLEIRAYSTMVPGLKWIDLSNMLQGVVQAMWQRALFKEAHVKMYDEPSGIYMGVADLYRSPVM